MPVEKSQASSKPASFSQNASTQASNLSPGPYIAIVKNNVDPQRMGRLQVWVSLLSPDENDQSNWVTVSYASPFYGYYQADSTESANEYGKTKQSYGMWMVPPDLEVRVLVTFANGDITKGFWFACIMDGHSHYMVPSLGSSINSDWVANNKEIPADQRPDRVPVMEYNDRDSTLDSDPNWASNKKPLHQAQLQQLRQQGLDFDYVRGPILSSSQRESPSQVFGISTPGRIINRTDKQDKKLRKGGHTFVMDDGDISGDNNFLRLRTGAGHQILMHDSGDFIYISNAKGTAWIELDASGNIDMYSEGNFSLRAANSINLHADQNINMYAGNKMTIVAEQGIDTQSQYLNLNSTKNTTIHACDTLNFKSGAVSNWESSTAINIKAGGNLTLRGSLLNLNCGPSAQVQPLPDIPRGGFPNAVQNHDSYRSIAKRINSVASRVPTHEPDVGHSTMAQQVKNPDAIIMSDNDVAKLDTYGTVPAPPVQKCVDANGNVILEGVTGAAGVLPKNDNTRSVSGTPKNFGNLADNLKKQPDPASAVGTLTKDETKAYMTAIGTSESGMTYNKVNSIGYVGKYQFGAAALVDQGYISKEAYQKYGGANGGNAVLNDPSAWTGKDGLQSKDQFLNAGAVQEKCMQTYTESNYKQLVRSGAIQPSDDPGTVSGVMASAHLLGPGGAYKTRYGESGADAYGTTGTSYVQKGKYAIATLTKNGSLA